MIKENYVVNEKEYNLKEAVELIRAGKWEKGLKAIKKTCGINDEEARTIGINIKNNIAKLNETLQGDMSNILSNMLITSGFDFQGYSIIKYIAPVAGESVIGSGFIAEVASSLNDITGSESPVFSEKIKTARDRAYNKLLKEAALRGANAVIGLKFDYFDLKSNIICVCAQGTAVNITRLKP